MFQSYDEPVTWTPGMSLGELEKLCIIKAYRFYRENKTQTASALRISIRTLDAKLEQYERESNELVRKRAEERKQHEAYLRRAKGLPPLDEAGESVSQGNQKGHASIQAQSGNGKESPITNPSQLTVPMQERKEVQEVLFKQASGSGKRK